MSRIRRIAPGLGRGGLLGNTEGPEAYLRELDTLPSQFCRATGGTETVISQGGKFYRVHTFTDTDPTSQLLNFDGTNGSTTFTDDSGWGHAVTANGNSQISTAQSVFGGSSLYLDGTGDYLTIPVNAPTQFGTGDFTVETWCRFDTLSGVIADELPTGATASGWQLYYRSTGSSIAFYANSSNVLQDPSSVRVTTNTWYHIAVTRSGSTARLFIDGEEVASATLTTDLDNGRGVVVGSPQPDRGITNAYFNGYIDSLRITKGQALYTSAFTPPTQALTRVGSGSLTFTRGGAVEYLVVGGGGSGGLGASGGGGGAGGYSIGSMPVISAQHFVAVGAGGAGTNSTGENGASSTAFSLTSDGGGGGNGLNGGSGGGGRLRNQSGGTATGNGVGNDGGASVSGSSGVVGGGGGGGGANENGADGTTSVGGDGGDGLSSSISGAAVTYAGGGGGGGRSGVSAGSAGSGGGGDGSATSTVADSGTANTGGGGGGGGFDSTAGTGGDGGSGIVIARYRITQAEYEAEAA